MIRNTNVVVLHTRIYQKLTIDNYEKEKESGVFILKCPQTKKEIQFRWVGKKERNEIRKIYREIKEEYTLKLVS